MKSEEPLRKSEPEKHYIQTTTDATSSNDSSPNKKVESKEVQKIEYQPKKEEKPIPSTTNSVSNLRSMFEKKASNQAEIQRPSYKPVQQKIDSLVNNHFFIFSQNRL